MDIKIYANCAAWPAKDYMKMYSKKSGRLLAEIRNKTVEEFTIDKDIEVYFTFLLYKPCEGVLSCDGTGNYMITAKQGGLFTGGKLIFNEVDESEID
ncbi:MAG: hypothetical protein IJQ07_08035 [Clostridia bacterium]|nr:hypothetical protein [Clostridia bacterium]